MYAVAARLDPDSYLGLARATYAEMALAGITAVGEFHYLHHAPGGAPYADPNAMGRGAGPGRRRRRDPADPARHLLSRRRSGTGRAPRPRVRSNCASATATPTPGRPGSACSATPTRFGSARRSIRCARCRARRSAGWRAAAAGRPLHVHLSEQPAENDACRAFYGRTPTELLDERRRSRTADDRRARDPPHRRPTSPPWAGPAPRRASARPPNATWPTASAPPARCGTPVRRSASGPISTPSSTCSRRRAGWRCTSGWPACSGAGSPPPTCCTPRPGTTPSAGPTPGGSRSAPGRTWSPCGWTARGPPGWTRRRSCWRRRPPTSTPWWWTGGPSSPAGSTGSATSAGCWRRSNRCGPS